jgi:hypothetical protein
MHIDPQGRLQEAGRRAHRARKASGRIFVWGVGFGAAYFLDPENGAARRARLRTALRRTALRIDSATSLDPGEPPPVFSPLRQALGVQYDDPRMPRTPTRTRSVPRGRVARLPW